MNTDDYDEHTPGPWEIWGDKILGPLHHQDCKLWVANKDKHPEKVEMIERLEKNCPAITGEDIRMVDDGMGGLEEDPAQMCGNHRIIVNFPEQGKPDGWWGDLLPEMEANMKLMADAPLLLAEVKRLRIIETAAQLYGDYCKERHHQMDDAPFSFERWLDWVLTDDELGKMMIHYDQEALDDMKSKATYYSPEGCGFFTDYSKLNKEPSFVEKMRGKKKND